MKSDARFLFMWVALLNPLAAIPAAPEVDDTSAWQRQTQSVLDLLLADTQQALARLEPPKPRAEVPPAPAAKPTARQPEPLRLASLYGTDGSYTAIVYVGSQRKEYRPGASLPYGGAGGSGEYRLIRVIDSCVVLQKAGASRPRSACYQPAIADDPAVKIAAAAAPRPDVPVSLNDPLPAGLRQP